MLGFHRKKLLYLHAVLPPLFVLLLSFAFCNNSDDRNLDECSKSWNCWWALKSPLAKAYWSLSQLHLAQVYQILPFLPPLGLVFLLVRVENPLGRVKNLHHLQPDLMITQMQRLRFSVCLPSLRLKMFLSQHASTLWTTEVTVYWKSLIFKKGVFYCFVDILKNFRCQYNLKYVAKLISIEQLVVSG